MSLAAHAQKDSKAPAVKFHQEKIFGVLAEVTFSFRETHLQITVLLQISRLIQLKAMLRRHTKLKIVVTFQMEKKGVEEKAKQYLSVLVTEQNKNVFAMLTGQETDKKGQER